jgi:hypothetical protein
VRDNKDATGKAYGQEIYAAAQKEEGHISSVSYAFPRPNDPTPTAKVSFITRVGDVFCAVGFYEAPPRR